MKARTRVTASAGGVSNIGPACVASVEAAGRVMVTTPGDGERRAPATLAVVGGYAPRAGDTVLVATGADGERYVIGVLAALDPTTQARVTLEGDPGAEVLAVRDHDGRLLFEHRAAEGRSVVYAPAGDLEFRAPGGNIDLVAAGAVRVRAARGVDLESATSVRLATAATPDLPGSRVALDARGITLETPALGATARRAALTVGEARLVATTLATAVETARHVVGVLETQATRIVERAKNTFRETEELAQTRAGRMRLVAEATFHLVARRTLLKADEDMKLKADKIHLG